MIFLRLYRTRLSFTGVHLLLMEFDLVELGYSLVLLDFKDR